MLTNPESLCARVLKARYFKDSDILQASCPKGGSYTWRSIIHGRDLLKKGLIWRIGDGKSVDVWSDSWIPRASTRHPLGRRPDSSVEKVSELLLPDGQGWDELKLNEVLFESDVDDILRIPVGRAGTEDYLAWNHTKKVSSMLSRRITCADSFVERAQIVRAHRPTARDTRVG
jgi:hypothetical protein